MERSSAISNIMSSQLYHVDGYIANHATGAQSLALSQDFDDLAIGVRQHQKNVKIVVNEAGRGNFQRHGDMASSTCKTLERAFPLNKVSEKFPLLLLNIDGLAHNLGEPLWRIRKLRDIEKLSCKKRSYITLSEIPDKLRREFSAHKPVSLNVRILLIHRNDESLQILLTVDSYDRSEE